jgi:hypothetical protein
MRIRTFWLAAALLLSFTSLNSQADALTAESLHGQWLYTHILMEGGKEISVNFSTTFLEDGSVIFQDALGKERGRGSFTVQGDTILYKDDKGAQPWKLVSLENDSLHVDHRGAEMFFTRQ